jgi:hypothetical protein
MIAFLELASRILKEKFQVFNIPSQITSIKSRTFVSLNDEIETHEFTSLQILIIIKVRNIINKFSQQHCVLNLWILVSLTLQDLLSA